MMKARLLLTITTLVTSLLMVGCASNQPTFGKAAIATSHPLATQAGFRALDQGGNAFDAAVAAAAVLSVVTPYGAGLGGGSFWLLQDKNGNTTFVDARERSPSHFIPAQNFNHPPNKNTSLLSAAIPGQPAALAHISNEYGLRPLAANLSDAIRVAERGFRADKRYRDAASKRLSALKQQPSSPLLFNGGAPSRGDVIKQPELAQTLTQLGRKGHKGFYSGEVAKNMVADISQAGGVWTLQDLLDYSIVERAPLSFQYKDITVTTAPPPSSEGISLQRKLGAIELIDRSDLGEEEQKSALMRVISQPNNQTELKTSSKIIPEAGQSEAFTPQISVLDKRGNRVSASLTVNMPFGSAFISSSTGVLLNNSMASFADNPNTSANNSNKPELNERPMSYMTPTLIEAPGSLAIISTSSGKHTAASLLLTILDFVDNRPVEEWPSGQIKSGATDSAQLQEQYHSDMQVIYLDKTKGIIKAISDSAGIGQAIVR
ncbi:gamma-glutamyltransferase [Alkalimarinus coralli]|uniref:gamma-glutamyltransferase n=1 Tax=Alkalimarinus coralli TaxID=2935863 RepID=UPI00202AE8DF|nr:gamma-glutamyltransferase [Alkalimarinus coralli]